MAIHPILTDMQGHTRFYADVQWGWTQRKDWRKTNERALQKEKPKVEHDTSKMKHKSIVKSLSVGTKTEQLCGRGGKKLSV